MLEWGKNYPKAYDVERSHDGMVWYATHKAVEGKGGGEVTFLVDTPDRILLQVKGCGGGLLLLADTWAPGWSVRLDGEEAPLLRADTCMRGVALPPGDHKVEFLLSKAPFRLGLLLLAAGLALLALLVFTRFPGRLSGERGHWR